MGLHSDTRTPGWRTRKWGRPMTEVLQSVNARERVQGREIVRLPIGHVCEICGQKVDRWHPLHYNERPDRAEPVVVRQGP